MVLREWPRLSDAPKKSPGSVDMLNRFALYTPIDAAANARRRQTFLRLSAEPLRLLVGAGMVSPFAETSSFKIEIESPDGCHQADLEISWRPYPGSVKRAVGLTVVFSAFHKANGPDVTMARDGDCFPIPGLLWTRVEAGQRKRLLNGVDMEVGRA